MLCLLQRVSTASVSVGGETIAAIGSGVLVFAALEPADDEQILRRMARRIPAYRLFSDAAGKMNLSLTDTGAGLLVVSQFTLAADTAKGNRAGFSTAMAPAAAEPMFEHFLELLREQVPDVASGRFGAEMQVSLVNDGPVTFLLRS